MDSQNNQQPIFNLRILLYLNGQQNWCNSVKMFLMIRPSLYSLCFMDGNNLYLDFLLIIYIRIVFFWNQCSSDVFLQNLCFRIAFWDLFHFLFADLMNYFHLFFFLQWYYFQNLKFDLFNRWDFILFVFFFNIH